MLRAIILSFLLFSVSVSSFAESASQPPSYTLDFFGGFYQPADSDWESYYGNQNMIEMSASGAARFFSILDIGASASLSQDKGSGWLPSSQLSSGVVSLKILPLDIFAVLRLRFSDRQWVVPYAGGGYTRFFYQQSLNGKRYARGSVSGLHAKAGFQVLLDSLDPVSAKTMFSTYGVLNSYLVFEGKVVKVPTIGLGGVSYRIGLLIEY